MAAGRDSGSTKTLLIETFGTGLNAFLIVDTGDGNERPLLSAAARKVSNPRISPDSRWLAFDATTLREMIVPAIMHHTAAVVAPDQIVFVLGDFRGDVWIRDV